MIYCKSQQGKKQINKKGKAKMNEVKRIMYGAFNGQQFCVPWAAKLVLSGNNVNFVYLQDCFTGNQKGGSLLIVKEPGCAFAYGQKRFNEQETITYFGIDKDGKEIEFENLGEVRAFLRS